MNFNVNDRVTHVSVRPIIGVGKVLEVPHDESYLKVRWENKGVFNGQNPTYADSVMHKDSLRLVPANPLG
jgi:hypothetical protein